MNEYVDLTITLRVEATDCKEGIEKVEKCLGNDDSLAVNWPVIERVQRVEFDK